MTFKTTFKRGDRIEHRITGARGEYVRLARSGSVVAWDGGPDLSVVDSSEIKHGPVVIVGPRPSPPPTVCPDCGGALELMTDVIKCAPGKRRKTIRAVICSGCEFVKEV